jgi:hypothetical protein
MFSAYHLLRNNGYHFTYLESCAGSVAIHINEEVEAQQAPI